MTVPISNPNLSTPSGSAVQWDKEKALQLFDGLKTNDEAKIKPLADEQAEGGGGAQPVGSPGGLRTRAAPALHGDEEPVGPRPGLPGQRAELGFIEQKRMTLREKVTCWDPSRTHVRLHDPGAQGHRARRLLRRHRGRRSAARPDPQGLHRQPRAVHLRRRDAGRRLHRPRAGAPALGPAPDLELRHRLAVDPADPVRRAARRPPRRPDRAPVVAAARRLRHRDRRRRARPARRRRRSRWRWTPS